jgi:hypothetical protein
MVAENEGECLTLTLSWEMLELLLLTFWTMRFVSAAQCDVEELQICFRRTKFSQLCLKITDAQHEKSAVGRHIRRIVPLYERIHNQTQTNKNKLCGFSPQANSTDRATAACRRS